MTMGKVTPYGISFGGGFVIGGFVS